MLKNKHKKNSVKEYSFFNTLNLFLKKLDALNKSVMAIVFLEKIQEVEQNKINNFITKKGRKIKKEKGLINFTLLPRDQEQYKKLKNDRENSRIAYEILPQSLLVSKVTQFDLFIGSLIKIILNLQNNIISDEKILTFGDLKEFKTIKEAVNHVIEREIDNLLFDSHSAHLEWIGKKLNVNIKEELTLEWASFIEITERRNLYVHTNGFINNQYISKCKEHGFNLGKEHKNKAILEMTPDYFKNSSECLYKVAVKLTFIIWIKLIKNEKEIANRFFINEIIVELIKDNNYTLAKTLLQFSKSLFSNNRDEAKKIITINLALVEKLIGNKEGAKSIINSEDWSSCKDDFKLVLSVLEEKYDEVFKLMEKIGKEGDLISEVSYINDPIYSELRQQPKFLEVYKKIYKRNFISEEKTEITSNDKK